jgi:transposase-like protein
MPRKKTPKKKGRPSKYTKGYCKKLIAFFDVEPYEDRELEHFDKDGNVTWVDYKRMANRLPTIITFAKQIGVDTTTIYEWLKQHKEFSLAFTRAKEYQKYFLIENGLNGCYNPLFAKFVAINITDMRDVQEVEGTHKHEIKLNDKQLEQLIRIRAGRNNSGKGGK